MLVVETSGPASAQKSVTSCASARPYITRSEAAQSAGDSATALKELKRAAEVDADCADVFLLLGIAEFRSGAIADAIGHYKRTLALQPGSYSAHYNLALAYVREHKLQEARTQLERAVALDRSQADAAYNLGVLLLELGEPAEAVTHLLHAKALTPERPDVAFNVIRAELEAGRTVAARAEAENSAKRFGSDFQWNAGVGQLFFQNTQFRDAIVYLAHACQMRPQDAGIRNQLGLAYLESRQPDLVLSTIVEPKTSDDYYLRASAYYTSHRFAEADSESETALQLAPDSPQILTLRTRLLQRAGAQDEALQTAQKAIALAPNWDEPYYLAGISYYFIRRNEQAEASLARAVELNPKAARALFLQATALANLGKSDDAERCLRRAIALQPKNARLFCHLGILLVRKNELKEGEASLRRAILLKPEYGLSHYELGKLLAQLKQLRPAATELELAVQYDPGLSSAYYQLSLVYTKVGELEKSKRALAEFNKLRRQEAQDVQSVNPAIDADARMAAESPEQ